MPDKLSPVGGAIRAQVRRGIRRRGVTFFLSGAGTALGIVALFIRAPFGAQLPLAAALFVTAGLLFAVAFDV